MILGVEVVQHLYSVAMVGYVVSGGVASRPLADKVVYILKSGTQTSFE